ncbi:MAG: Gx transporter family protein [Magnetococcus sp. MYC-9]
MNSAYAIVQPRGELLIAYLAAAAVGTHLLETALPGMGPWFKPGLANTFTLVAYFQLGWRAAAGVTLIRVLAGSIILGTFLSPTFLMSVSGAAGALLTLRLLSVVQKPGTPDSRHEITRHAVVRGLGLGPVGVSVLTSLAHIVCQVLAAWLFILGHAGVFLLLPWFLFGSWLTGIVNGLLAFLILERLAGSSLLGVQP